MNKDTAVPACLGLIVLGLIMIVGGTIFKGYIFSILWGWFAVTIFEFDPLSIVESIGILTVFGFFFGDFQRTVKTESADSLTETIVMALLYTFLVPAFSLLMGWIVYGFMV